MTTDLYLKTAATKLAALRAELARHDLPTERRAELVREREALIDANPGVLDL